MSKSYPSVALSNGIRIPIIGLGSGEIGGYNHESVIFALKVAGYTHIDTAASYGSEKGIGEDLKASGISRDQVFITTKIWPTDYGYEKTKKSLESSLLNLDTEYVDLFLMSWPDTPHWIKDTKECLKETWKAMEELYEAGKCRAIGVSNYLEKHLEEMLPYCSVKPHVNQIEFHPYCFPKALIEFCSSHDITVCGYCPLAKAEIIKNNLLCFSLEQIACRHNKSIAQVLIRWSIQHNVVTIPKSTKVQRVSENIDVFDFELTDDEMIEMDALSEVSYFKAAWEPRELASYKSLISNPV